MPKLALFQKCIAQLWKKHSCTKHYSIVKTDVIKLSIRKVNLLYILKAKLHIFESIWRLLINNAKDLDLTDDQVNAKFLWTVNSVF